MHSIPRTTILLMESSSKLAISSLQEEQLPYEFFVHETEVRGTLAETLEKVGGARESEKVLEIIYQPLARFRVQAVTRCSSSIPGQCWSRFQTVS